LNKLAAIMTLVVLFGVALSYAQKGVVYDQLLEHNQSEATADNGKDISYLYGDGCGKDCTAAVCDNSTNGRDAVYRLFDRGNLIAWGRDENGADKGCGEATYDRNFAAHDACVGRWNDEWHGCGPDSDHGK
jgi:hypothetical protein